ncbi:bifunctional protein hlde, partial [Plakobranchus ocellatus]
EFQITKSSSSSVSTAAVMEGKLKEKLESMGIGALCVAQSHDVPLESVAGAIGVTCLLLSVRLAHSSLMSKLTAREQGSNSEKLSANHCDGLKRDQHTSGAVMRRICQTACLSLEYGSQTSSLWAVAIGPKLLELDTCTRKRLFQSKSEEEVMSKQKVPDENQTINSGMSNQEHPSGLNRCLSMPGTRMLQDTRVDARAEYVYTVGCFDLFHHGHVMLMRRMRQYGKKVIVGVHDSRSIYHLKHRVPMDSTMTRMRNVKQYADEVFCVAGTDPTPYLDFIFDRRNRKESAIYIRGDDMPQFPARHLCEDLMTVKLLPYTEGVSSTTLRKNLLNSSSYDVPDGAGGVMIY